MSWSTFAPWQTQYQNKDEKSTPSQSYSYKNAPCWLMQHLLSLHIIESNILFLFIFSCGQLFYNTASAVLPSFNFSGSKPQQHHYKKVVKQCGADEKDCVIVHNNDLSRAREELTELLDSALLQEPQLIELYYFYVNTKVISKEAHQRLGTNIESYRGASIPWSFCGRSKPYWTVSLIWQQELY
ncbi:uncharacterized protein BP01DRAFT_376314 [Aspergillus saccharolyticus JOP 1030-1]|uniref:Uncharacterized protein n=1 Tax=Aspergillus saccharolyticus JOP 1030-1 TaxID=1450539 RepID=A0A318Z4J9_9EURO|nr:hypothetical protein BP01DRAFT_376314 [Aspergillus saccharolyticus JOP 1030-1]PYH42235.1 hypothetical protein BP01DRAFT_376314 [Aspergillus saccharolyticus JOP 1030-1]